MKIRNGGESPFGSNWKTLVFGIALSISAGGRNILVVPLVSLYHGARFEKS